MSRHGSPPSGYGRAVSDGPLSRGAAPSLRGAGVRRTRHAVRPSPCATPGTLRAATRRLFLRACSANVGRRPVGTSRPSSPLGPGRCLKTSWRRIVSPSMPCTSVMAVTMRRPSGKRSSWMMTSIAALTCSRMARTGRSKPAMSTIVSSRDRRVARVVGVHRGHRAFVTGVHGLQHVERLGAAALTDDDAVGPHTQGVLDQVADADLAGALPRWTAGPRA